MCMSQRPKRAVPGEPVTAARLLRKEETISLEHQAEGTPLASDTCSDEALLQAIAGGAVWAMEVLYQRYHRLLYTVASRLVSDHHLAENLVQEVFFAVWRHATSYALQAGSVRRWLVSIMYHHAIDYLRSAGCRFRWKEVSWEKAEEEEGLVFPDVWEEAWRAVQRAQVRAALMNLPNEQRLVIELVYFQGWTQREIAERYQLPLGTVKGRIRLGLWHLKRTLEQRDGQES